MKFPNPRELIEAECSDLKSRIESAYKSIDAHEKSIEGLKNRIIPEMQTALDAGLRSLETGLL